MFRYGDTGVDPEKTDGLLILDAKQRRQLRRDPDAERRFLNRIRELGFEKDSYNGRLRILERRLPPVLATLLDEGWTVTGNRTLFRTAGALSMHVGTGIDWFELSGSMDFGDQRVALPELLAAARKGERFIRLADGSMGMLPQDWLGRHGSLLELGRVEDGQVRFAKTQIGLIDALLSAMPEVSFDGNLAAAREKARTFHGIQPQKAPDAFGGVLRPYQEHGLAWMNFLHDFTWGGCLADDMGLGKTIQVLALLLDRKKKGDPGPSLIVMPKSLVFNWIRETQRFAPELRVLDYTGGERNAARDDLDGFDLVFTTYGTLKRDIGFLSERRFNYVILDEAQAIKNPASQNAKAVRLLPARRRLVMTGTPVENRLGDLWSLFEFLNPGMLGTVQAFRGAFGKERADDEKDNGLALLNRTLRPFILRRTKDQVAPELPRRTEQTLECTMPAKQAAYYKELRDYYRESILGRVEKNGLAKSKVYVLEALLRLRQAACHPGLIDDSKLGLETAKMEAFLPMVTELVDENHKVLVFSQFVKMLDIVRAQLDPLGIAYEYLDGKTERRERCVERFQTDPKCPLFLISLKAGGTGLNLTAADYVIILDPWWNPAVEAQAIDRTHRIGQDKNIMAYRIITRDTVESKILELQKSKRDLADAIITEANSLIQNLTRDDLAMLLT
jgi:SNF2 family DNA or RNA helicase